MAPTGRGPSRVEGMDAVPAVVVEDIARDEQESQILAGLRRLSPSRKRMALEILRVLAR